MTRWNQRFNEGEAKGKELITCNPNWQVLMETYQESMRNGMKLSAYDTGLLSALITEHNRNERTK